MKATPSFRKATAKYLKADMDSDSVNNVLQMPDGAEGETEAEPITLNVQL